MSDHKDSHQSSTLEKRKKLHYVDNLRSSLTALVIVHHAATSYGGVGRNVYQSSYHAQAASTALVCFNAMNHSFFMSTFMYLGGHFSRRTLNRKSRKQFISDRMYRLGLPTVAYTVIAAPFCLAVYQVLKGQTIGWKFLVGHWKAMRGVAGPVWFTATLFSFDLATAGFDKVRDSFGISPSSPPPPPPPPTSETGELLQDRRVSTIPLVAALGLCSAAEFFLRIRYPVGVVVQPLKLQLGNVPPYIAAYIFGAYNSDVGNVLPTSIGTTVCLLVSGASSILLPGSLTANELWKGGWNEAAVSFALWGNFTGYLIGSSLLNLFRNVASTPWDWINRYSYPAFLLHMPILTVLGAASDKWRGAPVQKTAVVGGTSVVISWIGGWAASELWSSLWPAQRSSGRAISK